MQIKSLHEIEQTQGTVQLISDGTNLQQRDGIVLVPQPNAHDPNDPLNWSLSRRLTIYWTVLFFSAICNFCITGIAPGFGQIMTELGATVNDVSYLIPAGALGEAFGCYVNAPLASRFGKRPLWVGCITVFFICNIWAAVSKSFSSLLTARIFACWASGTSEPLSVDTLNELFFLHERGTQAGVQGIWLSFGASLAPVVCGFLIEAKGWRWFHWLVAIMSGVNTIMIFFLVPETQYPRDLHKAMDIAMADEDRSESTPESNSHVQPGSKGEGNISELENSEPTLLQQSRTTESGAQSRYVKKTFLQDIKPWSPVHKDASLIASFIRPWALFCYPSVVWTVMSFSIHVSCYVVILTLIAVEFGAPPYNFSESIQGLFYISSAVGNVLGAFFCGMLNDIVSRRTARKNHGVFQPEMRLPVVLFPAIVVPIGLVVAGVGFAYHLHWILPCIGLACIASGLTGIPSVAQPYLLDAYYPVAMDCLIQFNGFKNFVSFGVGFGVIPWLEKDGMIAMFCILAALVIVIDAGAIFIYIYGKKLRHRDGRLRIFLF